MVEYDTALIPNRYLATLDRGSTTPEDWKRRTGYSIGYPAWGLLYYIVLCRLDPNDFNLVIETGSNLGCSSIIIGQAIRDSKASGVLHTVEIDENNFARARENILPAGLQDEVQLHVGDSLEVLRMVLQEHESISLAFLDSDHQFWQVVSEFELIMPKLRDDSLVVFDNSYRIASADEDQRVNEALRYILRTHGGNLVNFPFCSWYTPDMAIWQKQPFEDMTLPAV
jgi:predicted O-methyltransferase YrrM